jgi:hypothetical protein
MIARLRAWVRRWRKFLRDDRGPWWHEHPDR